MATTSKKLQKEILGIAEGFRDPAEITEISERGKAQALGEIDKAFTEGAREKAAVAGAAGFSGAGGRTQNLLNELTLGTEEAKGAASLGYDEALQDRLFQRETAAADLLAQQQSVAEQQPKWYDYLLGGVQAAAPIVGALAGGGRAIARRPRTTTPAPTV